MNSEQKKNILLADDSEFFRVKASNILVGAGHAVRLAKDGAEVIRELEDNPSAIDLLVLDLQMPHIDGFKVLGWLKESNRIGKPPVLAVTGAYETSKVLEKVRELGAVGYVPKSATPEQLIFRVNKVLFGEKEFPRKTPRTPTNIPVDFTIMGRTYTGYILNISETGVFIYSSNEKFHPGDIALLKFSLPDEDKIIEAEGRVIWINSLTGEEALFNGMGIHFNSISMEDRRLIASFVKREFDRLD